ncbi:MAG: CaiB/BaiF CoA-transferase family protein [Pseudomonadota bacterium]
MADLPLDGVRIVDLSTLLPGPLATRLLAEAGAEVVKVERPGGEDLRHLPPLVDGVSLLWTWLNRGKRIVELDLKTSSGHAAVLELVAGADVVVEQFRPGVMARLDLAPDVLLSRFPKLVLCSITGFGQGDLTAGHDLTYQAESGVLGRLGQPAIPATLTADIAGGSWPAVINILLALRRVERGGPGAHLDMSMTTNLAPFLLFPLAEQAARGRWPEAGSLVLEGASPRYGLYRCADGEWLAVAALEDRFWNRLTAALDVPPTIDGDRLAARLAIEPLATWVGLLGPLDVCVAPLRTVEQAVAAGRVAADAEGPAMPLAAALRASATGAAPGRSEPPQAPWP